MLSSSYAETSALGGGMSPTLKTLLLPQMVEQRKMDETLSSPIVDASDLAYLYYTTNSSCSDVASPVTPTFSARGPLRCSSSTSSLELPPLPHEIPVPASPIQYASTKSSIRQLPDVEEEPFQREGREDNSSFDHFDLYSCLCDQPCPHRSSADDILNGDLISELDIDYDAGFLSDGDFSSDLQYPRKKRGVSGESSIMGLTSRLGSRFPTIQRWRSTRQSNLMASPTTELSLENVLSRAPSSRSSSMSAPARRLPERLHDLSLPTTPINPIYESQGSIEIEQDERSSLERDRAMATTPLLPPLMTNPLGLPPQESPLQSPTIAPSSAVTELQSPILPPSHYVRPSLSAKPSMASLRHAPTMAELPLPLPLSILQEHDEWSDRLGHANFVISPAPYEPLTIDMESVAKFREDWNLARVNYTKHLVRTGDNYGQTSKIYALTEAKWAETERRWKGTHDNIIQQTEPSAPAMATSRSRSRGRGRGRSESVAAGLRGRLSQDDAYGNEQWRSMEDCLPSAVPQMLEALNAEGKFPGRGDEDIVGPMQRDAVMVRARSEEAKVPRFWRNFTEKFRR